VNERRHRGRRDRRRALDDRSSALVDKRRRAVVVSALRKLPDGGSVGSRLRSCACFGAIAGLLLLVLAPPAARAAGGHYVFDGGSRAERGQVTAALNASSFDWNLVPGQILINIARGRLVRAAG
jgi:hypothetical protein